MTRGAGQKRLDEGARNKRMNLLRKLFSLKQNMEEADYEIEEWNEIVYDRDDLQIHNRKQRQEYVRGCLEQIAEASREVDGLKHEYQIVTSKLKDMEEIEALPESEKALLCDCARKMETLTKQQSGYTQRKNRLADEKFHQLEAMETELQEGYEKLAKTEEYQELIKRDLRRLDNERSAYAFRKSELKHAIRDTRSMTIVCATAVVFCMLLLLLLQYAFSFDVRMGYLAAGAIGAVAITAIFLKYNDSVRELSQVENGISRLIRLQNTVKIRYVNNTHLLDYLYMKYGVKNAGELEREWKQYQEEKEERHAFRRAVAELDEVQQELLHILRRYQVKDPMIWLHQTQALLDKKEMIEIRHSLIIRRQSLRKRMDYNKEVIAGKAQAEIKDLVEKYPKYANEILGIVAEYEKDFS